MQSLYRIRINSEGGSHFLQFGFHFRKSSIDFIEPLLEVDDFFDGFDVPVLVGLGDEIDLGDGQGNNDGVEEDWIEAVDAFLDGSLVFDGLGRCVGPVIEEVCVDMVLCQMPIASKSNEEAIKVSPLVL